MRTFCIALLLLFSTALAASDWPTGLVKSTYDRCATVGGKGQCRCVVVQLQDKFTFEDMRLAMHKKIAKEALTQMIRALNVKCLGKAFKEETLILEKKQREAAELKARHFR
ncbi:MAG TPA: hypothetical protein ENK06_02770 [Gammaproteobacteria bacterium]|nr:hypothetical protein [Gammaproteobacteria bacterium]